jgi:hypothetical protein
MKAQHNIETNPISIPLKKFNIWSERLNQPTFGKVEFGS